MTPHDNREGSVRLRTGVAAQNNNNNNNKTEQNNNNNNKKTTTLETDTDIERIFLHSWRVFFSWWVREKFPRRAVRPTSHC